MMMIFSKNSHRKKEFSFVRSFVRPMEKMNERKKEIKKKNKRKKKYARKRKNIRARGVIQQKRRSKKTLANGTRFYY